jgi:hypothetical protein
MATKRIPRKQYDTLLLVGEGETEEAFLKHVKALYATRGCGLSVKVICARGKGAAHVIDTAIRRSQQFDFDTVAALLDTDTDWGPDVARRATAHGIRVLMSEPCFETMMLRAIKRPAEGSADELKKRFALHVNDDGLEPRNYGATFNDETLQAARRIEKTLDLLLRLLRQ